MELTVMETELRQLRIREKRCARTLKGRALLVIDHILTNIGSEDELLGKLYRTAHCTTGVCGNPHEDWVKELEETYNAFVGTGGELWLRQEMPE